VAGASAAKADELLGKMIAAMGEDRETIHLLSLGACAASADRAPGACLHNLDARIDELRPRVIVALGQRVARALLGSEAPIAELRGRFHAYRGLPLMPTFHPGWLLRSASDKGLAWEDLKQVMARLRQR
jgi:DNA polymerase